MSTLSTSLKQQQKLRISLKMMTSLLKLNSKELDSYIQEEIKNNPYLEPIAKKNMTKIKEDRYSLLLTQTIEQ